MHHNTWPIDLIKVTHDYPENTRRSKMYFYTKVNMENCKKSFSIELNDTANCEYDGKWKLNTTCNYLDH